MVKELFFTFEGGEGAGKTTLIQSVRAQLEKEGCEVIVTREPGGTELGEAVRRLLLSPQFSGKISPRSEVFLFLAARMQLLEEVILPALNAGKIVLCDRFSDSTIAYQGGARSLGMEWVEKVCLDATRGMVPDRTFYLDVSVEEGLKRAKAVTGNNGDRMEEEKGEFHESVREAFLTLAKQHPSRILVINAHQSKEEVFKEVYQAIRT